MQFVVFEKFTSAYLFQIAQEKSCDYLLIIYIKKFRDGWAEGTHAYHAIREKLRHQFRHPGRALDLKTKDLIGHLLVSLIIDQSECLVCFLFLHCFQKKKTALLLTNQNGEFFSCIFNSYSSRTRRIWADIYKLISGKSEKNNCFSKFSKKFLDFFVWNLLKSWHFLYRRRREKNFSDLQNSSTRNSSSVFPYLVKLNDNGSYHGLREPITKLENHYHELKIY